MKVNTGYVVLLSLLLICSFSSIIAAEDEDEKSFDTNFYSNDEADTVHLSIDDADIYIRDYEFKDYRRNPRMEEKDRQYNQTFKWRPGLEIITNTDKFQIYFFEEKTGWTPWETDNLAPGSYRVRLEKTGYRDIHFQVNVKRSKTTKYITTKFNRTALRYFSSSYCSLLIWNVMQ
jgi:hypothetical protein